MKLSAVQTDSEPPIAHLVTNAADPWSLLGKPLDFSSVEAWMSSEISADGKCLKSKY